jgi:hypothetical protein
MGFEIHYRSTRPITRTEAAAIERATKKLVRGRTWLSCEPVILAHEEDGHLGGGSKPNFEPHPDDAAAAAEEGLPDGTTQDLLDILCELSREYRIDWEISHDYSGGQVGHIRNAKCDGQVRNMIRTFANFGGLLGEYLPEFESAPACSNDTGSNRRERQAPRDEDDGPPILKFRPRES